jgi:hypothetical protein
MQISSESIVVPQNSDLRDHVVSVSEGRSNCHSSDDHDSTGKVSAFRRSVVMGSGLEDKAMEQRDHCVLGPTTAMA